MSLTSISSLESARRKFFMISSQNMCNNLESNVFGLRRPKMSLTGHKFARIGEQEIFH